MHFTIERDLQKCTLSHQMHLHQLGHSTCPLPSAFQLSTRPHHFGCTLAAALSSDAQPPRHRRRPEPQAVVPLLPRHLVPHRDPTGQRWGWWGSFESSMDMMR
jgi:hypothetical protein